MLVCSQKIFVFRIMNGTIAWHSIFLHSFDESRYIILEKFNLENDFIYLLDKLVLACILIIT